MTHVDGGTTRNIRLFTLSTCIWCKKTKAFLKELDIGYDYIDVDLLQGAEREETLDELKRFNPRCSFPSLVVDGKECIVGYDEERIRGAVGP
jgi:glutaredoxin